MPSGGFVGMDSFPFNPKSNFGQKRITLKDFNNVKNLHGKRPKKPNHNSRLFTLNTVFEPSVLLNNC